MTDLEAKRARDREYARKRYAANPERKREASRLYRDSHLEQERERVRRWRASHPDRARESQRKWREKNPDHQRERRSERLAEARWWLGGKCVHCGATEDLEFDHIDPATKFFEVTVGWTRATREFFNELEKCQLLCHDCHVVKTREDRQRAKVAA